MKKILERRKDIVFYVKLYPLVKIHPKAYEKSMAIACQNSSLELLEDNFAGKKIPPPECKTKEVDENLKLGEKLGITGTPTIILPDGSIESGAMGADTLILLIDRKP
jgi:thiol:disulfide interchange protein DsbC